MSYKKYLIYGLVVLALGTGGYFAYTYHPVGKSSDTTDTSNNFPQVDIPTIGDIDATTNKDSDTASSKIYDVRGETDKYGYPQYLYDGEEKISGSLNTAIAEFNKKYPWGDEGKNAHRVTDAGTLEVVMDWFQYQKDGKVYLYLTVGMGCGGCVWGGHYLSIDPATDKFTLHRDIKVAELIYPGRAVVAPDSKRLVYLEISYDANGVRGDDEKIYIYDVIKQTSKLLYTVPSGASAMTCGDGCYFGQFNEGIVTFKDNSTLVLHLIKQEDQTNFCGFGEDDSVQCNKEFYSNPIEIKI